MDEIVIRLNDLANELGEQVLSEKRLVAFIKDYFPDSKREHRILEKGLELGLYKKFKYAPMSEILIYRQQIIDELCTEHGLNEKFAEETVDVWIRLVEVQKGFTIIRGTTNSNEPSIFNKAADFYKKGIAKRNKKHIADLYNKNREDPPEKANITEEEFDQPARPKIVRSVEVIPEEKEKPKKPVHEYDAKESIKLHVDVKLATYIKEAEKNNANAQTVLGSLYYNGKDVGKNMKEAVKWFRKAAEQGEPIAQNNLGYCYFYGYGVQKNISLALFWFKKSANKGEVSAMMSLANCYYEGTDIKKDITQAIGWYSCAAEQGESTAQFIIGECYYKGEGVQKSKTKALEWFQKAARQNHKGALERVAELSHYRKIVEARVQEKNPLRNRTELGIRKFTTELMDEIGYEHLRKYITVHSDKNNIENIIKAKISGLGIELDTDEQILFLFRHPDDSVLRLSDCALFTTNGIYINKKLKKFKFVYYADIFSIKNLDGGIYVNRYFIECFSLPDDSISLFVSVIYKISKEYK